MTLETLLRAHPPDQLAPARRLAHRAVQLATKAARANLTAAPDDSHSNLSWDAEEKHFHSQPIKSDNGTWHVAIGFAPLEVSFVHDGDVVDTLDLDQVANSDAEEWLDHRLEQAALTPISGVKLPYGLPSDVGAITHYDAAVYDTELSVLSAWFDFAHGLLEDFRSAIVALSPGPGAVRCWPHHFDMATYVSLEAGDVEDARGIGVGMAPGDTAYGQPYFYVNPWPHLDPGALPDPPKPGHWHSDGFVGVIATADEVLGTDDLNGVMRVFLRDAFTIGRARLGI